MSGLHTARVAPERTNHSARLAAVLFAESSGETEMASKYSELLRRPEWQKKRLEVMEAAGWKCSICGDATTTFNVHHRVYIKGRKPWEYENNQLDALCEPCHAEMHEVKDRLLLVLAAIPPAEMEAAAALLAGYYNHLVPDDLFAELYDAFAMEAGILARAVDGLDIFQVCALRDRLADAISEQQQAGNVGDSFEITIRGRYNPDDYKTGAD